jgi:hypothetical protein
MTDRFSPQARRAVESQFLAAGDELRASLAYDAMMDVNYAEDSIRTAARRLRDSADDAERALDSGTYLDRISTGNVSEDLNQAIARRGAAFKTLARILTPAQLTAAQATHDAGACRYGIDRAADCTCPTPAATA